MAKMKPFPATDFATVYARLKAIWSSLNVIGGCCGTDHRHVEAICRALL